MWRRHSKNRLDQIRTLNNYFLKSGITIRSSVLFLLRKFRTKTCDNNFQLYLTPVEQVSRARPVSGHFKMAARTKISASLVTQFVNVTGASKDIARSLLEACNGNLEMAIEMHLDSCEVPESQATSSSSNSTSASSFAAGSASSSIQYVWISCYVCFLSVEISPIKSLRKLTICEQAKWKHWSKMVNYKLTLHL